MPTKLATIIDQRFEKSIEQYHKHKDAPAFDLIRASVNLTVASILIAIATSMKLPLSTTYVTFMVAMGTALADGVWGRETAVYRVSGVLTVIGSRFLTALSAFVGTALIAIFIWYGGSIAIGILITLSAIFLYKTHMHHKKKAKQRDDAHTLYHEIHATDLPGLLKKHTTTILPQVSSLASSVFTNIIANNDTALKQNAKEVTQLAEDTRIIKSSIHNTFVELPNEALEYGEKYVHAIDYLRKCATGLDAIASQARDYALNQHPDLIESQQQELNEIKEHLVSVLEQIVDIFEKQAFDRKDQMELLLEKFIQEVELYKVNQLQRIKSNVLGVRNTMLYFTILTNIRSVLIYLTKLVGLGKKLRGETEKI